MHLKPSFNIVNQLYSNIKLKIKNQNPKFKKLLYSTELYSVLCGDLKRKKIQKSGDICTRTTSFPGGASGKEPTYQCRRLQRGKFGPWVWKIPWRRAWQPTQYSCLENPMDTGAWRATVHGVAKSRTQLKRLSTHAC